MSIHYFLRAGKLMCFQSLGLNKLHEWVEFEFGLTATLLNMNMRGRMIIGVEEKSESILAENRGHGLKILNDQCWKIS